MKNMDVVTYYSIGGGFIEREGKLAEFTDKSDIPYPIQKAEHIIKWCHLKNISLAELSMAKRNLLAKPR